MSFFEGEKEYGRNGQLTARGSGQRQGSWKSLAWRVRLKLKLGIEIPQEPTPGGDGYAIDRAGHAETAQSWVGAWEGVKNRCSIHPAKLGSHSEIRRGILKRNVCPALRSPAKPSHHEI
jgi:hypothetical protein